MFPAHHNSLPVRKILVTGFLAAGACTAMTTPAQAAPLTVPGIGTVDVPAVPAIPPLGAIAPPATAGIPDTLAPPPAGPTPEQRAVTYAESKIGAPYVWGATGPDTFDCSGLMQWAYQQAGVSIPRTSQTQEAAGASVGLNALQPGDLVFFYNGEHVGIYTGNGNVIHSPEPGDHVKTTPISAMPADTARRY
ncbi:C40 family peptidase [Rhodococcus jostii]|uniref:C40 family peptidase n=1 Tax=Rhodococcus jostii TaxID=132919 RepID=UPI003641D6D2